MQNPTTTYYKQALPYLFLTEMWERFGFYIVQGLLVLYLTKSMGMTDNDSFTLMGIFTALVYISPIVGGYLADKLLGFPTAITIGGYFLIFGYVILALPFQETFYLSLAIIIIGNGLFKPNISSLLGQQYAPQDPNRDSGFTVFYIGINIGVLLAGFSSGYIKDYFGWHASFALAGFGLVLGLIIFNLGMKKYNPTSTHFRPRFSVQLAVGLGCLVAIGALYFILKLHLIGNWLLPCVGIILLAYLIRLSLQQEIEYRKKMFVLITLILASIVFWTLFLQLFFSANLYIDRLVDKNFFGLPLTTTIFYASESVFIIALGPLFAWLWDYLSSKDSNPAPFTKFTLGIFCVGVGFFILAMSTAQVGANNLINPLWIFAAYMFITLGELFISPIGLSAITMLAPEHLVGFMMGTWFVATGFGGIFAGWVAKISSVPEGSQTVLQQLAIYHHAFLVYAIVAVCVAATLYLLQLCFARRLGDSLLFQSQANN